MTSSAASTTIIDGPWLRDLRNRKIRRILIIKWSGIGDVAIATATMQDIRDAFPHATIDLNTMAPCDRLFSGDPRFDDVFCFDLRGGERGVGGHWRWLRYVRAKHYDLVVDLQCTDHTRILLALLPLAGGWIPHRLSYYRKFPFNIAPSVGPDVHHTRDYAIRALAAAGLPARAERPVLYVGEAQRSRVEDLKRRHGLADKDYAVLLPGATSTGAIKRWGADRYRDLAQRMHASGLGKVLLLGGPDEIEECHGIERRCGRWLVNLCGETELLELVPLCEGARYVVGNDTGPAHVAAASGTPMVVICGPTDPRRVKPLGPEVVTVQADLPCINCYLYSCDHHTCMRLVTPNDVLSRLGRLEEKDPPVLGDVGAH